MKTTLVKLVELAISCLSFIGMCLVLFLFPDHGLCTHFSDHNGIYLPLNTM